MRGGVVSRTGDRVGDALEMRTRRVGVDGFVAFGGERSIFFWQLSLLRWAVLVPSVQAARLLVFFCLRLPSGLCSFLGSQGVYLW